MLKQEQPSSYPNQDKNATHKKYLQEMQRIEAMTLNGLLEQYFPANEFKKYVEGEQERQACGALLNNIWEQDQALIAHAKENESKEETPTLIVEHSLRMVKSVIESDLNEDIKKKLVESALLHDYGKIAIQPEILNSKITNTEGVKRHFNHHNNVETSFNDDKLATKKEQYNNYTNKKKYIKIITLYGHPDYENADACIQESEDDDLKFLGILLNIFDTYEAMTSKHRSYESAYNIKQVHDTVSARILEFKERHPALLTRERDQVLTKTNSYLQAHYLEIFNNFREE